MLYVFALALLPALILLYYVYSQDRLQPEPFKMLAKGFGWGCLSVLLSLCISGPLLVAGLIPPEVDSFASALTTAFVGAAIPEECAKLLCLHFFLRRNPWFDERMDGIVYAVCVGMGFAAFENLEYLIAADTEWVTVGIGRSLTAIPGHFGFAVIMGYYYSLYRFGGTASAGAGWKMIVFPILAHGCYDAIAMTANVTPELSGVITVAVLIFVFQMVKWARKKISVLQEDGKGDEILH